MRPTLNIEGLAKRFGSARALDQVSFSLAPGERLALIGHNGSGKSTLIRCLLGLHNYEGTAEIFGMDARRCRETILGRVSFVPQLPPALRLEVGEYLRLGSRIAGVDRTLVDTHCEAFGFELAPHMRKPFLKLSGGMKQKLLIAVALSRSPELLIMDEPTANLDAASRTAFLSALAALPEPTALLLVSHRVDELVGLVSRSLELDHGRIVRDEPVRAVSGVIPLKPRRSECSRV